MAIVPTPAAIPHLAVPFAVGPTGSAQTVAQGSLAEVLQSVANLVGTEPGTRLLVPTYGTPDPSFAGLDRPSLTAAVAKWEPRALVRLTSTPTDPEKVTVQVGLASGGSTP